MEERCQCTMCLREVNREDLFEFGDELLCPSCLEEETTVCDRCGDRIWRDDAESDSGHTLCFSCYDRYYTRCSCCGRIIHEDDAYTYGEDNEKFNETVLIATSVLDCGVNIHDDAVRDIVIFADDPTAFMQMLGRKRLSNDREKKVSLWVYIPARQDYRTQIQKKQLEMYI